MLLGDLLQHITTMHKMDQIKYKCPFCIEQFDTLHDVGVHQHSHVFDQQHRSTNNDKS